MNPDHVRWNADAQRDDPTSVLAFYRRLVALRHNLAVVALGDFTMLLPDHDQVYAFTRSLAGEQLLVVCNVGGTEVDLRGELPDLTAAELVLSNLPDTVPGSPVLHPWEARVLRTAPAPAPPPVTREL